MCPTNKAWMSFFGFRFGHRSKASFAASAKISLAYKPSSFPNFDNPADIIETRGLPFNSNFSFGVRLIMENGIVL